VIVTTTIGVIATETIEVDVALVGEEEMIEVDVALVGEEEMTEADVELVGEEEMTDVTAVGEAEVLVAVLIATIAEVEAGVIVAKRKPLTDCPAAMTVVGAATIVKMDTTTMNGMIATVDVEVAMLAEVPVHQVDDAKEAESRAIDVIEM